MVPVNLVYPSIQYSISLKLVYIQAAYWCTIGAVISFVVIVVTSCTDGIVVVVGTLRALNINIRK